LTVAGVAFGYAGQVAATVTVSAPSGAQNCGVKLKVSALIQENGGTLISDQPVAWAWVSGNGTGDSFSPASSTTDANGIATTYVTFGCGPAHSAVLGASADAAAGQVVVQSNGKSLPRTDTDPAGFNFSTLLAALAVVGGSGAILRRLATGPR
jgi:hypothetical protein